VTKTVVVNENYISKSGTMVTLSYRQDGSKHTIRFESEDGQGPAELVFPSKQRARDHWRTVTQLLAGLGFKRFMK
jgi:hypothetical protein